VAGLDLLFEGMGNSIRMKRRTVVAPEDAQRVLCESCSKEMGESGFDAIDRHHWLSVDAVLRRTHFEPDAMQRIQIECTNYAMLAALLISAALPSFLEPPSKLLEEDKE